MLQDIGHGKGKYYAVNFPLRDGIDDETYQSIFKPVSTLMCSLCGSVWLIINLLSPIACECVTFTSLLSLCGSCIYHRTLISQKMMLFQIFKYIIPTVVEERVSYCHILHQKMSTIVLKLCSPVKGTVQWTNNHMLAQTVWNALSLGTSNSLS